MPGTVRYLTPIALLLATLIVLAVGIRRDGLWEPNEIGLIEKYQAPTQIPSATETCRKQLTRDDWARTLTGDFVASTSDPTRMRWPLVGLCLLLVLAVAGIAARLGGNHAAAWAPALLLSFPLFIFQARSLASEIGTAAGGALLIFGLLFSVHSLRGPWRWLDALASLLAVIGGSFLAFRGGGVWLGVLPPLGAIALAGAVGTYSFAQTRAATTARVTSALAGAACIALCLLLAAQTHAVHGPIPGTRAILGHSIEPTECVSPLLGGVWSNGERAEVTFDSTFEHIAFGTFPLGLLAPFAMALFLSSTRRRLAYAGALLFAWLTLSWVLTAIFQRKVGFATFAAFPAMAIAAGLWLSDLWEHTRIRQPAPGTIVIGVGAGLGILTLSKDSVAFPQKLTSLLFEKDGVAYPGGDGWLALVFGLGLVSIVLLLLALWANARGRDLLGRRALMALFGVCLGAGAFWSHGYYRAVSQKLSTKFLFDSFNAHRTADEPLGVLGDVGKTPSYYLAGIEPRRLATRTELWSFLGAEPAAFAMAPAAELCAIARDARERPFAVLASTTRTLLLSNRRADLPLDRNPLRGKFGPIEPSIIETKPATRTVFDERVELLGWSMPTSIRAGETGQVRLYFKALRSVGGPWKILAHVDGPLERINADHDPIDNLCATSNWSAGDYITDTFAIKPSRTAATGAYQLHVGFFRGSSGSFQNMRVSEGNADKDNRVLIGTIHVP